MAATLYLCLLVTTLVTTASCTQSRASDWLLKQRLQDWGWGSQAMTPRAILALQVASNFTWRDSLESQMSVKQMELEIVLQLWRHHEAPMTPGRLALYALALNAICRDPRQFHGHDLIGTLMHHEPGMESEFALTSLAVCSAGAHVRKRQLRHLIDIAARLSAPQTTLDAVFPTDTLAITLLAFNCIVRDHRNRNLERYVKKPMLALARTQGVDGNFGNLYSTALATQALKALDNVTSHHVPWSRESAESYLLSHQSADGSFNDVFTTTEVMLALSAYGVDAVKEVTCNVTPSTTRLGGEEAAANTTIATTAGQEAGGDVTLSYTIWVGTNITEKHSMAVTAPRNATFYYVMQVAGERDPHFVFAATEWPNGHYVHTLAGFKEEPTLYYYWLLYVLPQQPDVAKPPGNQLVSPVGVDGLTVEDGGHYLFWYKKL